MKKWTVDQMIECLSLAPKDSLTRQAAAELRRLHFELECANAAILARDKVFESNQELLEACCTIVKAFDALPQTDQARYSRLHINAARAAIAKAKEQK